jgi:hypothetical protein
MTMGPALPPELAAERARATTQESHDQ